MSVNECYRGRGRGGGCAKISPSQVRSEVQARSGVSSDSGGEEGEAEGCEGENGADWRTGPLYCTSKFHPLALHLFFPQTDQ